MKLELAIKKALRDNADCLGAECDCVAIGVAKAVRDFLLSDDVVKGVSSVIDEQSGDIYWAVEYGRSFDFDALSRAALSSITGDE